MSGRKPRTAVARIWEGRTRGGVAEFMTISYWGSRDEIRAYAGNDIEKTHHLPKDRDYLARAAALRQALRRAPQ